MHFRVCIDPGRLANTAGIADTQTCSQGAGMETKSPGSKQEDFPADSEPLQGIKARI